MKLTLITVHFRGRSLSRFIYAEIINGKATTTPDVIYDMAKTLGARDGETFSIG